MAKAKAKAAQSDGQPVSKSQAIRDMLAQHPNAKAGEVVKLLADRGVKVSPALVHLVRSTGRRKKARRRRQKAVEVSRAAGVIDPVKLVLKVRELALEAGGIKSLQRLVDTLAE
jgi:hypothetical protein